MHQTLHAAAETCVQQQQRLWTAQLGCLRQQREQLSSAQLDAGVTGLWRLGQPLCQHQPAAGFRLLSIASPWLCPAAVASKAGLLHVCVAWEASQPAAQTGQVCTLLAGWPVAEAWCQLLCCIVNEAGLLHVCWPASTSAALHLLSQRGAPVAPYEHCLSSICTALEPAAGIVGRCDCSGQGFYQDTTSHGAGACGSPTAWVGSNATEPGSGRLTKLNDVLHLRRGDPARAALVKLSRARWRPDAAPSTCALSKNFPPQNHTPYTGITQGQAVFWTQLAMTAMAASAGMQQQYLWLAPTCSLGKPVWQVCWFASSHRCGASAACVLPPLSTAQQRRLA